MKAKWLIVLGTVLTAFTSPVWAQSSSGASSSPSTSPPSAQGSQSASKHNVHYVQASKLIGSEIRGAQGESLGKVEDLVINPQNGKIRMAILGASFAGGQGEMFTPIPWTALNVSSERNYVLNVDQKKLSTAPSVQKGEYSQLDNPDYVVHVYTFYGVPNPEQATGGTGQGTSGQEQGSSSKSQGGQSEQK